MMFIINKHSFLFKVDIKKNFKFFFNKKIANNVVKKDYKLSLKYDVLNKDSTFTSFGILPFFQSRVNDIYRLNVENQIETGLRNVIKPTSNQKNILSILGSNYNLMLSSKNDLDSFLAITIYILNLSLNKTPNYKLLKHKKSVDTIIIVPNNHVVQKYKNHFEKLLKGIPKDCCPDKILFNNQIINDEYDIIKKPLSILYLYSDMKKETYVSGDVDSSDYPQILVSTFEGFLEFKNSLNSSEILNDEVLSSVKLIVVENLDLFFKTTNFEKISLIETLGEKKKYYNKLQNLLSNIKKDCHDTFKKDFYNSLTHIEKVYKHINKISSKFNHTDFVINCDEVNFDKLDYQNSISEDKNCLINLNLVKKLLHLKRKVFYKPIQFCFTGNNDSVCHKILDFKSKFSSDNKNSIYYKNNEKITEYVKDDVDLNLNNFFYHYLKFNDFSKFENFYYKITEDLVISYDIKRKQNNSKPIFNLDNDWFYNNEKKHIGLHNNLNTYFSSIFCDKIKKEEYFLNLDIEKNFPSKHEILKIFDKYISLSKKNVKNFEKNYLRYKFSLINPISESKLLNKCITNVLKNYRQTNEDFKTPFMVVVPSYINLHDLSNSLNNANKLEKFQYYDLKDLYSLDSFYNHFDNFKMNDIVKNLLVHPFQLIGSDFVGLKNMMVMGINSLFTQTAFYSEEFTNKKKTKDLKLISGLLNPLSDLFLFYYDKLNLVENCEKNMLFCFYSNLGNKERIDYDIDMQKLSLLIIFNNLLSFIRLKKFKTTNHQNSSLPKEFEYKLDDHINITLNNFIINSSNKKKVDKKKIVT